MNEHPVSAPHFAAQRDDDGLQVVVRMSEDAEPDLREIGRLVKAIKPLSQMLVQAANATSLGLRRTISDPEHAVALLGPHRTREMAERLLPRSESGQRAAAE